MRLNFILLYLNFLLRPIGSIATAYTEVLVYFQTDSTVTAKGFEFRYTMNVCAEYQNGISGSINTGDVTASSLGFIY